MTEMYSNAEMVAHLISLGHDKRSAETAIERHSDDLTSGGFRAYFEQDAAKFSATATEIAEQAAKSAAWFAANPGGNPFLMAAE